MTVRVDVDDDDGGGGPGFPGGAYPGGAGFPADDGPVPGGVGAEDWWHGLYASTPPGCDEPPIEPSVAAGIYLEIDVVDAAGFLDESVLSTGIMNGLSSLDTEVLDYRQAVALLDEASKLASAVEALKA
ncbi:hypothetical protein, partial [Arthrobacter pigmenti]